MIVILRRNDLTSPYEETAPEKVSLFHFSLKSVTIRRAELIVFLEKSRVHVLKAVDWPYGKPMSGAELLNYIAKHTFGGSE